jgi:hypothetical protein
MPGIYLNLQWPLPFRLYNYVSVEICPVNLCTVSLRTGEVGSKKHTVKHRVTSTFSSVIMATLSPFIAGAISTSVKHSELLYNHFYAFNHHTFFPFVFSRYLNLSLFKLREATDG